MSGELCLQPMTSTQICVDYTGPTSVPPTLGKTSRKAIAPQEYGRLSPAELVERSASSPSEIGSIVRARPTHAARIAQLAMQRGDMMLSLQIMGEVRTAFLAGKGTTPQAESLFRGVLALDGETSAVFRAAMGVNVADRDKQAEAAMPIDVIPGSMEVDTKARMLKQAGQDPGWGQMYAGYYDDPAKAAAQLHAEATSDPAAFKRHAGHLSDLFAASPRQATHFVHATLALNGVGSLEVKQWLAAELHSAMAPSLSMLARKVNDGVDGGPLARAERLVPLLAQVMSQPDVAPSLADRSINVGENAPSHLPSLGHMFGEVLDYRYSPATRTQVRDTITAGSAEMLRQALAVDDPDARAAGALRVGTLVGSAANQEAQVGVQPSAAAALGEMLVSMSDYLGAAEVPVKIAGGLIGAAGERSEATTWQAGTFDSMLRRIYRDTHPRPKGPDDDPAVIDYNNNYVVWRQGPASAYADGIKEGNRHE